MLTGVVTTDEVVASSQIEPHATTLSCLACDDGKMSVEQHRAETIAGIPQIIYKIPIGGGPPNELNDISIGTMLDRIIIGPSPYPWAMYEAFATALTDAGVADAGNKVFVSGIPLRG